MEVPHWSAKQSLEGGFQLLDLIITELKTHDLLKIRGLSLVEILFVKKKNSLQGLCSSLNAVFKLADRMRSMRTNGASKNRER